jgi:cell division protein FtsB
MTTERLKEIKARMTAIDAESAELQRQSAHVAARAVALKDEMNVLLKELRESVAN